MAKQSAYGLVVPEHMTVDGAIALARRIKEFWLSRGYRVATYVEHASMGSATAPIECVRSNMINGYPVAKAASPPQHAPAKAKRKK